MMSSCYSYFVFIYIFAALSSCDNIFSVAPNTFSTPGYPSNYPNRITCTTLIVAPEGQVVRLTFLDFELEGPNFESNCIWDSVNIYNSVSPDPNQLIGSYCGFKVPVPLLSASTTMFVEFTSDEVLITEVLRLILSLFQVRENNVLAVLKTDIYLPIG